MSNLKSEVLELEKKMIQLVMSKSHLTDKDINFKVNSIYRSTDNLKKLLNSLEDKQPQESISISLTQPQQGQTKTRKKKEVKKEPVSQCFAY